MVSNIVSHYGFVSVNLYRQTPSGIIYTDMLWFTMTNHLLKGLWRIGDFFIKSIDNTGNSMSLKN